MSSSAAWLGIISLVLGLAAGPVDLLRFSTVCAIHGFAEPIQRLLANPELRQNLGTAARARVLAGATWAHRHQVLLEAYRGHVLS